MMLLIPKEISGKIEWDKKDKSKVILKEGVVLTPAEKEIFDKYKAEWKYAYEDRFK